MWLKISHPTKVLIMWFYRRKKIYYGFDEVFFIYTCFIQFKGKKEMCLYSNRL